MIEWLLLLAILLLIAANGLFVAAEFSLVSVDRTAVERAAREGDSKASSVLTSLRNLSTQLSGAQLGITVTSLAVGFLIEPSLGELLRGPLGLTDLPEAAVTGAAVTLALVLATVFQMVFGELVPKNWAISEPMRVGRAVAAPQRWFTTATKPLISLLNGMANALLRVFGIEPQEELRSARRPQELAAVAARSGELGTLHSGTATLLQRAVEFGDRRAADVMTPRPQVHFLRADGPVAEVLAACAETGHARFPVVGSSSDDVVGAVHFKHALAVPADERPTRPVRDIMRPVAGVPSTLQLDAVLRVLQEPGLQLAVVVDEYGGTDGIVTFEDLVEEMVGDIADEHDRPGSKAEERPDGSWSVSGLLRPDELGRITGLELPPTPDTDTLAGLVVDRLGRVPDVGASVTVPARDRLAADADGVPTPTGVRLTVTDLDGLRVARAELRRVPADEVPTYEVTGEDRT